MRKLFCIILSVLTVFTCGLISAVQSAAKTSAPVPTVYVSGQGGKLYNDKNDRNSGYIYPMSFDKNDLFEKAMSLNVPFAKALATGNWDSWCDTFTEICADIFNPIALDKNGNPIGENGAVLHKFYYNYANQDGEYDIYAYPFNYDWRLDYEDVIDILHQQIQIVRNQTKSDKVNIVGRCIGADVVLAYVNKYGTEYVNKIILYCDGLDGFELIGKIYTGDMHFDKDAIIRYVNNYIDSSDFADDETRTLVAELVGMIESTYGLEKLVNLFATYYSDVYQDVLPRVLRETFGRFGSFWGLISDEHYEDAKKFVFGGYEDEYSELIKKIDYTHYNVTSKSHEIINSCIDSGVEVYLVEKYGLQMLPVTDNMLIQSDSIVELRSSTGGATCAPITETLSAEYISKAKENGTEKYISPDLQVDCSTAFLPDHTWCIKDCMHMYMPVCVDEFMAYILSYDGYLTVFDNEKYPQYLLYDHDSQTILPLTAHNGNNNEEWQPKSVFQRVFTILKAAFKKLADFLRNIFK